MTPNLALNTATISGRGSIFQTPPAALHFMSWMGQSLQGGNSRGANHTITDYGALAFPRQSTSPVAYETALASSDSVTGVSAFGAGYPNGEMPMFGTEYLFDLIEHFRGVRIDDEGARLLLCCNATGSTTIAQNQKGGGSGNFERTISQAEATATIAASEMVTARCDAVFWNQGEGDSATNYTTYKAALVTLQSTLQTDIRAEIPSANPVYLILNQTNSIVPTARSVPRAQFDAQAENALIIMSTPKYMGEYYDNLHLITRDSKWIGAYDALAWYYTVILGQRWQPLHFTVESIVGNEVTLLAVANVGSLVIDETTIPAQNVTNMVRGFSCLTSTNTAVPVTAVSLVGTNRVKVTLDNYSAGHKLRYALDAALTRPSQQNDGLASYVGAAGNIRDSFGDTVPMFRGNGVNRMMHKWAAGQEWTL